ncbi:hypothetical protein TNCV_4093301 [Trichonephila clavipes]|nr:hypothetical protein TNCV_4093301 [Trichonephila clavipes]
MLTTTVHNCSAHELWSSAAAHIAVPPTSSRRKSLPDSKLVLAKNGRSVIDFYLTLYIRSEDSHLSDEQQLLYLTRVDQSQHSRCFLPGLDCVQFFIDQYHVWWRGMNIYMFHEVDAITEKFCDPAFVDQETA